MSLTELKQCDIVFFMSVKEDPGLQATLLYHGFNRFDIHGSQHNTVFVITKTSWNIPPPPGQSTGLNIHFEARRRNELRIEIGLNPYIGNVEHKPELRNQLQPILHQKSAILARLRLLLTKVSVLPPGIHADTSALLKADTIKSHTIVKFSGPIPDDPTATETAQFFARVIDAVAPLVERELENYCNLGNSVP